MGCKHPGVLVLQRASMSHLRAVSHVPSPCHVLSPCCAQAKLLPSAKPPQRLSIPAPTSDCPQAETRAGPRAAPRIPKSWGYPEGLHGSHFQGGAHPTMVSKQEPAKELKDTLRCWDAGHGVPHKRGRAVMLRGTLHCSLPLPFPRAPPKLLPHHSQGSPAQGQQWLYGSSGMRQSPAQCSLFKRARFKPRTLREPAPSDTHSTRQCGPSACALPAAQSPSSPARPTQ